MDADLEVGWELAVARRLRHVRRSVYDFREEAGWVYRVALVFGFAAFTGICAQISFPLPFTPVPVTAQVFAVLLAGSVLGRWLGPASQAIYLGLGALGVPWFAPSAGAPWFSLGGWAALVGVTGGYLVGFLLASAAVGWTLDRGLQRRTFSGNLLVLLLGVGIIYLAGAVQFAAVTGSGLTTTLLYGVVPFVPGDMLKAVVAASVLVVTLPSSGRSGEAEAEPSRLAGQDYAAVVGVVAVTWSIAGVIWGSPGVPRDLVAYYTLAAGVCTMAAVSALALRRALARSAHTFGRLAAS